MITEKPKEALKNLKEYVATYCEENDISVLMTAAVSSEQSDGLEQVCSNVMLGKGNHIINAFAGCMRQERRLGTLLSRAFQQAINKDSIVIPMGNISAN